MEQTTGVTEKTEKSNNLNSGKIKLISAVFIFGTIGVFVRYIPLPSSMIAMVRGFVGMAFLLLLVMIKGEKPSLADIRRNLGVLCLAGAFIGINWILLFEAYRYTTVATATLCYYLAPIFVIVASPFILKERLTVKKIICVAAALIGMVFVSGVAETGIAGISELKGVLFGVGAAVFYAGVVLLNKQLKGISAYDMTIVQLGVAAVVVLPYTLLTENLSEMVFSPMTVLLLAILGIVHTGFAYALYFGSIKELKAQTVAIFSYIDPIVAILLSAVLLKEKLGLWGIIGAALVLGATFVSELPERSRK